MSAKKKPQPKAKTTAKTTIPVPLVRQANGGWLKAGGTPGNKGGTGRPPKLFKEFCSELAQGGKFQQELAKASTDSDHRHYPAAVKLVAEYGEGLPEQPISITVSTNAVRDRLAGRIAGIARTGTGR